MSYPLKIGVVGCGNIAEKAYLPFAQNRSEFKVAACTDVRAEMAQRLAANFDIPRVHASFDDMLADPEIDVVLNLTHPAAHAEVNLRAIEAGKHAYCEKPFALTREDGQAVLDKAREAGLRVGCAPDTVLGPGTQTARSAIAAGMIGEPATARVTWGNPGMESWHPNPEFYYKRGGGPMLDMGPYFVSSIVQMLGPIKSVTGRAKASRPDRLITSEPLKGAIIDVETPTHISGVIETQSGVHVLTLMSYDLFGEVGFNKLPEVVGLEGVLTSTDPNRFDGTVTLFPNNGELKDVDMGFQYEGGRGLGLVDMVQAIRDSRTARASGEFAFHVLDVLLAFEESEKSGRRVEIGSSCEVPPPMPKTGI